MEKPQDFHVKIFSKEDWKAILTEILEDQHASGFIEGYKITRIEDPLAGGNEVRIE